MPSNGRRRGRGARNGTANILPSHDDSVSEESVYGKPDPDNPHLCVWCKDKVRRVLAASCGHQFCKNCVEDTVVPRCSCPLDDKYISEDVLTQFLICETNDSDMDEDNQNQLSVIKTRVDRLSVIMNRLVEHLAIRNLLHECRATGEGLSVNTTSNKPYNHHSMNQGPIISDSEGVETPTVNQELLSSQHNNGALCKSINLSTLCNISLTNTNDAEPTSLTVTQENVRLLLPRFWQKATELQWSDEEKVQRLRMSCDSALQRLLDNADLFRKDWSYISSILYGDHLLDEVSMFRCLGSMKQRFSETPHQWYLRVCGLVERGLPPSDQRDWQIRATFITGLHPKYHEALGTGKLPSVTAILERCGSTDVQNVISNVAPANKKSGPHKEQSCYSCGLGGHVFRNCPKQRANVAERWTPWNQ